ncbi:MAG: glycosyltransferase family 2 protein [Candidatus Eisenbacteria bacterium]
MPRVSVLLPVRNAAPWLAMSLASLSRQTYRDFEIVAVDDGSNDHSGELLESLATNEPRLRVIRAEHAGLPATLQTALAQAHGELLMRHDADDLSHRERLSEQVAHLDAHENVGVVGSRVRLFPDRAYGEGMRRWVTWHDSLLTHEHMARERLIDSPLCHGTALLRREALGDVQGWRERGWAEDLDLWIRMFESGVRFAKLPRRLYAWRQHAASSTRTDPRYAQERFTELKTDALRRWLGPRRATIVGVGKSLERWAAALGPLATRVVRAGAPNQCMLEGLYPPIVLAFLAPQTRTKWRRKLTSCGMAEMTDFIFVA